MKDEFKRYLFKLLFLVVLVFLPISTILSQTDKLEEYKIMQSLIPPSKELKISSHPILEQYLAFYRGRGRASMEAELRISTKHEKMIRRIFREEGIPDDLFRIQQVEEIGFSGHRSWKSPYFLWIFLPETAKKYGLRQTKYIDERRSFEKATRAKAQYLHNLWKKYDKNWELALTAYMSGEGNVDRAIQKAKSKSNWLIFKYLPRNTRNFVPHLFATILIAKNPEKYGFENVKYDEPILYELVRVSPSSNVEIMAKFAEVSIETIKKLNPELISNETPPEPYIVRIPLGKGIMFAERMRKYSKEKSQ